MKITKNYQEKAKNKYREISEEEKILKGVWKNQIS